MWVEIISTAIATAAATHLGPKLYEFLRVKISREKQPKGPPLGNYIVAVDKKGESKTFKLKLTPAVQHTRLGSDAGTYPMDILATIPFAKGVENWTEDQLEAEIEEAAKDRKITRAEIAAYEARTTPQDELVIEFDPEPPSPWATMPPDYFQTPESQLAAVKDEIASEAAKKSDDP